MIPVLTPTVANAEIDSKRGSLEAVVREHQKQQRAADYGGDSKERHGEGLALGGGTDGAVCDGDVVAATDLVPDREPQDEERGDLDAAGGACAALPMNIRILVTMRVSGAAEA